MDNGLIHLYYGDGKGKTTAAVGLGVRAAGSGLKVKMIQFLKPNNSSEIAALRQIKNFFLADAPPVLPFYFAMTPKQKLEYNRYAKALFANAVVDAASYDLLIFDEILDAISLSILNEDDVIKFLLDKPKHLEVVLCGRSAGPDMLAAAHYVSKIRAQKHPFASGTAARKGIEY